MVASNSATFSDSTIRDISSSSKRNLPLTNKGLIANILSVEDVTSGHVAVKENPKPKTRARGQSVS